MTRYKYLENLQQLSGSSHIINVSQEGVNLDDYIKVFNQQHQPADMTLRDLELWLRGGGGGQAVVVNEEGWQPPPANELDILQYINGVWTSVVLNTNRVPEGVTNFYLTEARFIEYFNLRYLDELYDVVAPSPEHLNYLVFNANTGNWVSSPLIGAVTSVNGYTGTVTLLANDIPETAQRQFYSFTKLTTDLGALSINAVGDVNIVNPVNYEILTYEGGLWVNRPLLYQFFINDLIDVVIDSEEVEATPSDPSESLLYYNRTDNNWQNARLGELLNGCLLYMLFDVDVPDSRTATSPDASALVWDQTSRKFKLGAQISYTSSDDVPQGLNNLYLTAANLQTVANTYLELEELSNVQGTTGAAGGQVLGYNAVSNIWEPVSVLTSLVDTDSVPPGALPDRQYYSNGFVESYLGASSVDKFGDVALDYTVGQGTRTHLMSLVWNATANALTLENVVSLPASSTDDLSQGTTNLYFTLPQLQEWLADEVNLWEIGGISLDPVAATHGQVLTWYDPDNNGSGIFQLTPTYSPTTQTGDIIVRAVTGDTRLGIGQQNQILKVDFSAPQYIKWADKDNNYSLTELTPDIFTLGYSGIRDTAGLFYYLGTNERTTSWTNPAGTSVILTSSFGAPSLSILTNRTYYIRSGAETVGVTLPNSESITFDFLEPTVNLVDLVFQVKPNSTGGQIEVRASNNGVDFYQLVASGFSPSGIMTILEDPNLIPILDGRYLFKLRVGNLVDPAYYRYFRIVFYGAPSTFELHEVEFYASLDVAITYATLTPSDKDSFLYGQASVEKILVPLDNPAVPFDPGWQCYILPSENLPLEIEAASNGVYINTLLTPPYIINELELAKLIYTGNNSWTLIKVNGEGGGSGGTGGTGGDAATLEGQNLAYVLSRSNHTGTQNVSTISGLGTAAVKNTGTAAGEVLELTETGKLPALDGSLLTNLNVGTGLNFQAITGTTILGAPDLNKIYLVNLGAPSTITLPLNPTNFSWVSFCDAGFNLATHNLTINPSGTNTILGETSLVLDRNHDSVWLVFLTDRWVLFAGSTGAPSFTLS